MKLYNFIKDINIEGIKSAFQLLSFFHSDKGKSIKNKKNQNALQKILLTGPTWTDKEYKNFLLTKEQLKLFPQKWF